MNAQAKVCYQFPGESEIQNLLERLKYILWQAVTVIEPSREAQARRRIQLYYNDQWIDELAKAGTRIAKKGFSDRCNFNKFSKNNQKNS